MQAPRTRKRSNFLEIRASGNLPLSSRFWQRCQAPQRLSKTLHRDNPHPVGITASLVRVIPSGDEEDADSGVADADRLLGNAADRSDAAVEVDLSGRSDPAPV